jgi:hypothetical protein
MRFDNASLISGDIEAPGFVLEAKLRRELVHGESERNAAVVDFFFGHGPRTLAQCTIALVAGGGLEPATFGL